MDLSAFLSGDSSAAAPAIRAFVQKVSMRWVCNEQFKRRSTLVLPEIQPVRDRKLDRDVERDFPVP